MIKVYVCPLRGRAKDINAIKAILVEVGCEVIAKDDLSEGVKACDVLVILLCKEAFTDPTVAAAIELAVKLGKKIIGIWAQDATGTEIPKAFDSYGESTIVMEKSQIEKVLESGTSIWQTPQRELRPAPETARHKC